MERRRVGEKVHRKALEEEPRIAEVEADHMAGVAEELRTVVVEDIAGLAVVHHTAVEVEDTPAAEDMDYERVQHMVVAEAEDTLDYIVLAVGLVEVGIHFVGRNLEEGELRRSQAGVNDVVEGNPEEDIAGAEAADMAAADNLL